MACACGKDGRVSFGQFSLVDTGLVVHWLVSPSRTEFSFVHL